MLLSKEEVEKWLELSRELDMLKRYRKKFTLYKELSDAFPLLD